MFDMAQAGVPTAPFADRRTGAGLEMLTAAARGALFNIAVNADAAFDRIESELSGYYLLGVESAIADKDGKPHPIRVAVTRRARSVRSRRQLITHRRRGIVGGSPRQAAMAALASPLLAVGAAAARRLVLAAGSRADEDSAPHSRRHRHRLLGVEGRLARLRHHRSGRAASSTARAATRACRR